jgi:hypothetical protein
MLVDRLKHSSARIDYTSLGWVPWNYPCRFLFAQFLFRSALPRRSALVFVQWSLPAFLLGGKPSQVVRVILYVVTNDGVGHPISDYWNIFLAKTKLGSS